MSSAVASRGSLEILGRALRTLNKDGILNHGIRLLNVATTSEIKNELRRLKLNSGLASLLQVLLHFVKRAGLTSKDIERVVPFLLLYGIGRSTRVKWSTLFLEGKSDTYELSTSAEITEEIQRGLLRNNVRAEVCVVGYDSTFLIHISEKKLVKNKLKMLLPIFLAYYPGETYLFWGKRSPSSTVLQGVADGLGFIGVKHCKLTGYNLKSMLCHLLDKGKKQTQPIKFQPSKIEKERSIDLSQNSARRKYMEDLLGSNPPLVANAIVEATNIPWRGKSRRLVLETCTTTTILKFKTKDTFQLMKHLAEDGILKVPPPKYIPQLLNAGKNIIKLRAPSSMTSTSGAESSAVSYCD